MRTCPICGRAGNESRFCVNCGFDLSTDVVSLPTVCPISPALSAGRAAARQRLAALNSAGSLPRDGVINRRSPTGPQQAAAHPGAGAYARSGSQLVDSRLRTGEPAGTQPNPARQGGAQASGPSAAAGRPQSPVQGPAQPLSGAAQARSSPVRQPVQQPVQQPGPRGAAWAPPVQASKAPAGQTWQAGRPAPTQFAAPPRQQSSAGGRVWNVFRIILGAHMALFALICLLALCSGETGSDTLGVFVAMNVFIGLALLFFLKRKRKNKL